MAIHIWQFIYANSTKLYTMCAVLKESINQYGA